MGELKTWFLFRIVSLVVAFVQGIYFSNSLTGDFSKPNWITFFVLIGFVAFGIFFVISIQVKNPFAPQRWHRPSWFANPFVIGQPLIAFDLAAYYFLVVGVVSACFGINSIPKNWAWEIPLAIGIGAWLGVKFVLSTFSDKFSE